MVLGSNLGVGKVEIMIYHLKGGIWFLSDEQKKSVLNALVEEFILGPAGEIEIRYKLPVTEKQLQDTVASMLSIDKGRGLGG